MKLKSNIEWNLLVSSTNGHRTLRGTLQSCLLGLDSSGDKVALTPWVNHYFKYFAHIFHCYKNIFFADETYCVLCTLCAVGNSYGCRVSNSNVKTSTLHYSCCVVFKGGIA